MMSLWSGRGMRRSTATRVAMCRPTANMPKMKALRNVSGDSRRRACWPSQTPTMVGAMAATLLARLVRWIGALPGQHHGQHADDEQEHDAERLHQLVPVHLERLHVGQERHGGDAGHAGDQRRSPTPTSGLAHALGPARHVRPPRRQREQGIERRGSRRPRPPRAASRDGRRSPRRAMATIAVTAIGAKRRISRRSRRHRSPARCW